MIEEQPQKERLSAKDWRFVAACIVMAALCLVITARWFDSAFPETSIDFKFDRNSSRVIAEQLLREQHIDFAPMKHAALFDSDSDARIFLERSLGLERANKLYGTDVQVWTWHHRWFRPLVEEELSVDVAPAGAIIGYAHKIPEERALPAIDANAARAMSDAFLQRVGAKDLQLVEQSERRLPKRVQRIFTYESTRVRPAGAPLRHTITIDGNVVSRYSQGLKVPDAWLRSYRELRSKNNAAGAVDTIFLIATMIGAIAIFIARIRRGDVRFRFVIGIGIAAVVLVGANALNSMPSQLAFYDTTTSYPAFLAQLVFGAAMQSLGTAMLLIVICGAGEVLYREHLPQHLAIPRLWTRRALASKRVFRSLILGYALVPLFIAYQVVFYLVASKYGAWAPAEVPYDDLLNSVIPWAAVLFAGFFPALSEEFLSRAFSIPFFQRFVRSRFAAIVLAGFVWGFGHATYPNQPFYIRGVEVGIAGVVIGLLLHRFGLLPLLIWHYTVDAVYTATLLFRSGNTYYIVSAAAASLIFAIPLLASIALYLRNKGFVPDDDLSNAALPVSDPPPHPEVEEAAAPFPPAIRVTPVRVIACVVAVAIAALLIAFRPPLPSDAIDYPMTKEQAKEIAKRYVKNPERFRYIVATSVEGFRSWNPGSSREEGGAPGDFDDIAATYLVRHGVKMKELLYVWRDRITAATYTVRFFSPMQKEEIFVEVDPRSSRVVGFHKYQDERNAGAKLDEAAALAIARNAINEPALEVKESLSFQQPNRRDWLFHFQEPKPIAGEAYRRVTVRVAGNEVTQRHTTIHVPESVYRAATEQTLLNVILFVLKLLGSVTLLALVIAGLVTATRAHGLPWRRALRWTAIFAIVPIAAWFSHYETTLFTYPTTMAWETFRISLLTDFVRDAGLQLGAMLLALAGLEAALPYALSLARKEGRARFGRAAAIAAITAVALFAIVRVGHSYVALAFPQFASVAALSVPDEVVAPLPGLLDGAQALFGAVIFAAIVALYASSMRRYLGVVTLIAIFCVTLDGSATMREAPLMLASSAVLTALAWVVARYVLGANPLAWPAAAFLVAALQGITALLTNHRADLIANGVGLLVFAIAMLLWLA
ncbi:MAG TPA: CPBP family intramembrane glutamic endopeptidase, partial [Thermoanaerobaculia bacterium]|nr:CPBP family intramembrane glutamic endopeptidase [Thermoanaerobaculia bacterium]